jgi:hypothetical protein
VQVQSVYITCIFGHAAGDFRGLKSFSSSFRVRQSILLYAGNRAYREGIVDVLPWREALTEIAAFLR